MANNDVQHLLDMLYEMIDGAKNAPLTSDKCILNRDEALDLLDEGAAHVWLGGPEPAEDAERQQQLEQQLEQAAFAQQFGKQ